MVGDRADHRARARAPRVAADAGAASILGPVTPGRGTRLAGRSRPAASSLATVSPRRPSWWPGSMPASSRAACAPDVGASLSGLRLAVAQHPRQMAERLLVLAALDRGEVARELEQHALLRHQLLGARGAAARLDVLEEVADLDPQRARDLVEPAGRDAVDAGLVLVRLLIGDADQLGHLLLGQAEHDPALADAQADVVVDVERAAAAADAAAGDFAGKLVHRSVQLHGTAKRFPVQREFRMRWDYDGKIGPLETAALEKNCSRPRHGLGCRAIGQRRFAPLYSVVDNSDKPLSYLGGTHVGLRGHDAARRPFPSRGSNTTRRGETPLSTGC